MYLENFLIQIRYIFTEVMIGFIIFLTIWIPYISTEVMIGFIVGLIVFLTISLAFNVYFYVIEAKAFRNVAKLEGRTDGNLAWIPVANTYLIFSLGGIHPLWSLLFIGAVIPIVGWVMLLAVAIIRIIQVGKICERYNVNPTLVYFSFIVPILYLVPIYRLKKQTSDLIANSQYSMNNQAYGQPPYGQPPYGQPNTNKVFHEESDGTKEDTFR